MNIAALNHHTLPAAASLILLTSACSTVGPGPETTPADAEETQTTDTGGVSIPQKWLDTTTEAYPQAAGFAASQPTLMMGEDCLILEEEPEFFADEAEVSGAGFGSYGRPSVHYGGDPSSEQDYRYLCDMRASQESRDAGDNWGTPEIQLMVTENPELAEETVQGFLDHELPDQDNDIQTVEIDGAEIHVTKRSFPTNPNAGGELQAIFYDEEAQAIFQLRMQSMDEDLWEEHGHEGAAQDLVDLLRR